MRELTTEIKNKIKQMAIVNLSENREDAVIDSVTLKMYIAQLEQLYINGDLEIE